PRIAAEKPAALRGRPGIRRPALPLAAPGTEGPARAEARPRCAIWELLPAHSVLRGGRVGHAGRSDVLCVVSVAPLVHLAGHPDVEAVRIFLAARDRWSTLDRHRPGLEFFPQSAHDV